MASFHNAGAVGSQVGNQHVHGDVNHYHFNSTARNKRSRLQYDDSDPEKLLDDEILASLAYPEMFYRRCDIHEPHRMTCQWIFGLNEYITWTSQPSGLLWIKGKPGAGKSTLMAHLYRVTRQDKLKHHAVHLDFFFTARGTPLQRTMIGMLRSLLNQLFCHDRSIRSLLRTPFQEKQGSFGDGKCAWEWRQPELQRIFTDAVLMAAKQQPLVIFIDALDEAGEQAAYEMARYFHDLNDQLQQQSATAKVYISCRHFPILPKHQAVEIWVERHNQKDIAAYIQNRLSIQTLLSDDIHNSVQWRALVQKLADTAHGVFQWVCLVVPMIEKFIVQGYSPERIQKWLSQVPDELGHMYKHMIEQLMVQDHKSQSRRLFQWVCLAVRPMSVTEIRHALASHNDLTPPSTSERHNIDDSVDNDKTMDLRIRSWSGGLLEVAIVSEGERTLVQPIHQSVTDFWLAEGLALMVQLDPCKSNQAFSGAINHHATKTVASCHGELYWCCMNYMLKEAADFVCPSFVNAGSLLQYELGSVTSIKFPLLEYASSNCLIHAHEAEGHRGHDLGREASMIESVMPICVEAMKLYQMSLGQVTRLEAGTTPLHVAAAADLTDLAHHLLDCESDVDAADAQGQTALHLAALQGHMATAKILVAHKADVQKATTDRNTPLTLAALKGHMEFFSWLLSQGAGLSANVRPFESALFVAASMGRTAIVRLCIQAGAEVNIQKGGRGSSALQVASRKGHEKIVQMLLGAGAKADARGGLHGRALVEASRGGHERIVQMLLDAGAEVNSQGGSGGSALQEACFYGRYKTVQVLLEAGADVNAQGGVYGNVLQTAIASPSSKARIVRMLVEAGAEVNARGGFYGCALEAALQTFDLETAQILIEAGAKKIPRER